MKKILSLNFMLFSAAIAFGQIHPTINTKTNHPTIVLQENLLDGSPGFKRQPIKFVPIKGDISKGYQDNKVYEWTDPNGFAGRIRRPL